MMFGLALRKLSTCVLGRTRQRSAPMATMSAAGADRGQKWESFTDLPGWRWSSPASRDRPVGEVALDARADPSRELSARRAGERFHLDDVAQHRQADQLRGDEARAQLRMVEL